MKPCRIFSFLILFVFLIVVSCTSTKTTRFRTYSPKIENCQIEFFTSEREIPTERPYEVLGIITHERETNNPDAAMKAIRSEACSLGADAVILDRLCEKSLL